MRKIILLLSVCALLCGCKEQSAEKKFTRNNDIIQNPGQGWMSIGWKMDPKLPYGSRYVRFHWKSLEPEEGKYNWEPIDKEIARAEKLGIPFSFRVMCASAHSATPYASPEWVFKKRGAKFAMFKNDPNGDSSTGDTKFERVTPIFEDPVFIKLHERFIKALAERYDGDPRISTIDIGSYGNWGEWHTFGLGIKPAPLEVRKQYADMYLNNFKKTDLVFMTDDAVVLKYAIGDGEGSRVGLRRDGVGGEGHYDHWIGKGKYLKAGVTKMGDVWKYKPMLFEWYVCYSDMLKRKWPLPKAVDFILSNHASLVSENLRPSSVPAEEYAQVEKISRGVGARIFVDTAKMELRGYPFPTSLSTSCARQTAKLPQLLSQRQIPQNGCPAKYPYSTNLNCPRICPRANTNSSRGSPTKIKFSTTLNSPPTKPQKTAQYPSANLLFSSFETFAVFSCKTPPMGRFFAASLLQT